MKESYWNNPAAFCLILDWAWTKPNDTSLEASDHVHTTQRLTHLRQTPAGVTCSIVVNQHIIAFSILCENQTYKV